MISPVRKTLIQGLVSHSCFKNVQMTNLDGERFMIQVRLLAAHKYSVLDNGVAKCDALSAKHPTIFRTRPVVKFLVIIILFFIIILYL